jgi:hypothetical protein
VRFAKAQSRVVDQYSDTFAKLAEEECTGVIPNTFIACGEGGNYCSEGCEEKKETSRVDEILEVITTRSTPLTRADIDRICLTARNKAIEECASFLETADVRPGTPTQWAAHLRLLASPQVSSVSDEAVQCRESALQWAAEGAATEPEDGVFAWSQEWAVPVPANQRGEGPRQPEAVVSTEAYMADPRAAHDLAEREGRVLVKDPDGMTRLVINSNESTEALLEQRATEAYPGELEALRKVASAAWLVVNERVPYPSGRGIHERQAMRELLLLLQGLSTEG